MKQLFAQKLEKICSCLASPEEARREIMLRLNALKVSNGYKIGSDWAPFPSTVLLVVNEFCNQRCRICDIGRREENSFYYREYFKDKGFMEKSTFRAVVASLKGRKAGLWFLATEPLLYADLFWAIGHATSNGIEVQLTTNGYFLPEASENLVRSGLKRIILSIDGHCAKVHDYIRDCPGSYDKVMKGLNRLIEAKKALKKKTPSIFINTAISQWNFDSLEKIVEMLCPYDIAGINLSHLQFLTEAMASAHSQAHQEFPITGRNIFNNDRTVIVPEVLHRQLAAIRKKYKQYRINITPDLKTVQEIKQYYFFPDKCMDGYSICYMPWRYPHILANGDVVVNYECFSNPMGNINIRDLFSIWNGDKFRAFRKFIRENHGSTPACWRCPMIYCGYKF